MLLLKLVAEYMGCLFRSQLSQGLKKNQCTGFEKHS